MLHTVNYSMSNGDYFLHIYLPVYPLQEIINCRRIVMNSRKGNYIRMFAVRLQELEAAIRSSNIVNSTG